MEKDLLTEKGGGAEKSREGFVDVGRALSSMKNKVRPAYMSNYHIYLNRQTNKMKDFFYIFIVQAASYSHPDISTNIKTTRKVTGIV